MVFSADSQIYRNLSAKIAEGMLFFRGNGEGRRRSTPQEPITGFHRIIRSPTDSSTTKRSSVYRNLLTNLLMLVKMTPRHF